MHWGVMTILLRFLNRTFQIAEIRCSVWKQTEAHWSIAAAKRMNWKWSSVRSDCEFGDMKGVLEVWVKLFVIGKSWYWLFSFPLIHFVTKKKERFPGTRRNRIVELSSKDDIWFQINPFSSKEKKTQVNTYMYVGHAFLVLRWLKFYWNIVLMIHSFVQWSMPHPLRPPPPINFTSFASSSEML